MKLYEYRIPLPCSCEEFQRGQLFSVARASERQSSSTDRVEFLKNEPYEKDGEKGQYTYKLYHLNKRAPAVVRAILPASLFCLEEHSWNAFPHCKTVIRNQFLGSKFQIVVESRHYDDDVGERENAHGLDAVLLKKRQIINVDIAADTIEDPNVVEDPTKFVSKKTNRGPLDKKTWKKTSKPMMCAYKLVTAEFKVFGLQRKVEKAIQKFQLNMLSGFHRQVFCWIDDWFDITLEEIRSVEERTQRLLAEKFGALNKAAEAQFEEAKTTVVLDKKEVKEEGDESKGDDDDDD